MADKYYEKAKMTQIIMDLIYLYWEMKKDGNTDKATLERISTVIEDLKYYCQFLK